MMTYRGARHIAELEAQQDEVLALRAENAALLRGLAQCPCWKRKYTGTASEDFTTCETLKDYLITIKEDWCPPCKAARALLSPQPAEPVEGGA